MIQRKTNWGQDLYGDPKDEICDNGIQEGNPVLFELVFRTEIRLRVS